MANPEKHRPILKIYWLVSKPHCDKAKEVKQVDGKIAYVCKHKLEESEKERKM